MTMSKHTPAPWGFISDESLGTLVRSDGLIIAKIRELEGIDHKANAKLIAAAPELLEALEAMKDYCKYHKISLGSGVVHKVDEAIKKATL